MWLLDNLKLHNWLALYFFWTTLEKSMQTPRLKISYAVLTVPHLNIISTNSIKLLFGKNTKFVPYLYMINLSIHLQTKTFSLNSRQYSTAYLGIEEQWGEERNLKPNSYYLSLWCQFLPFLENKSNNIYPTDYYLLWALY